MKNILIAYLTRIIWNFGLKPGNMNLFFEVASQVLFHAKQAREKQRLPRLSF